MALDQIDLDSINDLIINAVDTRLNEIVGRLVTLLEVGINNQTLTQDVLDNCTGGTSTSSTITESDFVAINTIVTDRLAEHLLGVNAFVSSVNNGTLVLGSNVDLSPIQNMISTLSTNFDVMVNNQISPILTNVSLIDTNLTSVHSIVENVNLNLQNNGLSAVVSALETVNEHLSIFDLSTLDGSSLNGQHGSYPDGSIVLVSPSNIEYTINHSHLVQTDEYDKTVVYKVYNNLGMSGYYPHSLVTLKV